MNKLLAIAGLVFAFAIGIYLGGAGGDVPVVVTANSDAAGYTGAGSATTAENAG